MLIFIGATAVLTVLVALYAIWGRRWLKAKTWPWSIKFFQATEPAEIALWGKSETLLWTRFVSLVGILYAFLSWLGALDVSPFLILLPEKWRPWLTAAPFAAVALGGLIGEILRRGTTKPLELVAVPDRAPLAVREAVEHADLVGQEAVAEVVLARQATPRSDISPKE